MTDEQHRLFIETLLEHFKRDHSQPDSIPKEKRKEIHSAARWFFERLRAGERDAQLNDCIKVFAGAILRTWDDSTEAGVRHQAIFRTIGLTGRIPETALVSTAPHKAKSHYADFEPWMEMAKLLDYFDLNHRERSELSKGRKLEIHDAARWFFECLKPTMYRLKTHPQPTRYRPKTHPQRYRPKQYPKTHPQLDECVCGLADAILRAYDETLDAQSRPWAIFCATGLVERRSIWEENLWYVEIAQIFNGAPMGNPGNDYKDSSRSAPSMADKDALRYAIRVINVTDEQAIHELIDAGKIRDHLTTAKGFDNRSQQHLNRTRKKHSE